MAQTYDDAARVAARELRIRIERDLAAGRFLTSDADDDAARHDLTVPLSVRTHPRVERRGLWRFARRA